jgi:hypothetical protein
MAPVWRTSEAEGMSAVLQFDPVEHSYSVDGREIPSVTQILKSAGMVDFTFTTEFARERGSMAHRAIHYAMENDLDDATVHPMLVGYVSAARAFVADLKLDIVAVERRVYSPSAGYAGTLDLLARLGGKLGIFDHKTGPPPPATALQLAAYADAYFEETGERISHRYAAHLHQDGRYTLTRYADRHDTQKFRAALTVAAWRKENGLL